MQVLELLHTWGLLVLGAAVVFVAFLVNRFAPQRRRRIRGALVLYVISLVATGASLLLMRATAYPSILSWADHAQLIADLCAAFTMVNVVVLLVFDVSLPAVGFTSAAITNDIIVAVAYMVAGFGVLKAAGFSASSVVTTSAVVSGVLALSMQATLGNILGGFALQLDGSIHVGDWIQLVDATQGRVIGIRWRHTLIETRNWDTIVVPNANLLAQNIVLLGKRTGKSLQHRMWVYFAVDFRFPPSRVIDVVREALCAAPIEGVADDPKPSVICYDFARDTFNSCGYYAARYWLTDLANDDPTSSRVRGRIYTALRRATIPLARPAQTVFVNQEEDDAKHEARRSQQRLRAIECVNLFHTLTDEERAFVSTHLRYAPFTAGETCTRQGAVAHWLYVLTSGKVEVRRHAAGSPLAKGIATIEAPSFFGEMGLMAGEPRSADVVALTDVECYRLDKEGLKRILEQRPEVAEQFSKTLAKRKVDLLAGAENLDEEAKLARMATEETDILDKIQNFFGLARTTQR